MIEYAFFREFLILLAASALVAFMSEKLRISSILGFLLAGTLIGPHALGWIENSVAIHSLAEIGVVFLMLTIGLECNSQRFKGIGKVSILGGSLQLIISIALTMGFAIWQGWSTYQGFLLGSIIALSSTALVLKHLLQKGELETQHGRISLSILLFQDFAVIFLLILTTNLGSSASAIVPAIGQSILKAGLLIGCSLLFARWVLPWIWHHLAQTQNREVLFLGSIFLCMGMAWIGGELGLSFAIGAFLAGFMFAETDFAHHLMGEISPFRTLFVSIFFISLGLLVDVSFIIENLASIGTIVCLVLVVNFLVMSVLLRALGQPLRVALSVGLLLSQIGEFAFILMDGAHRQGALSDHQYQLLLSSAFMTLLFSPLLFSLIPFLSRLSSPAFGEREKTGPASKLDGHVILCGYGPAGRDIHQTLVEESIPHCVIEINPVTVKKLRDQGIITFYGDSASRHLLLEAGILRARSLVVSFPDPLGIQQIISSVEDLNPDLFLLVRTRFEREMPRLYDLGADAVVMEEWLASFELNRILMHQFQIPDDRISKHLDRIHDRKELSVENTIFHLGIPNNEI